MKFKKTVFACAIFMVMSSISAAPIENVNLSQSNDSSNPSSAAVITPTASAINVPTNLNWELVQKTERLENEVRTLRGSLEEQQNTIDQLKKDADNHYNDLDQRLQLLQQKVDPDNGSSDDSSGDASSPAPTKPTVASTTSNPVVKPQDTAAPVNAAASSQANQVTNTAAAKPQNEKQAYTAALDAYKQGGAKSAITPMQNFIKTYPNSQYIGNAHFWLAEFYLAVEPPNYNEAKKNYEIVAKQYPQSAKASRSLYQLYSIAKNIDKNSVSADLYRKQLLAKYPKSEEAGFVKKV